jgi:hypothetical protein
MGERGSRGACPSPAGFMHILGMAISFCVFLLEALLILRGAGTRVFRVFPLFYSYIIYCFCGFLAMCLIYWLDPQVYPSAYWIFYLVSILVQFAVLVEISDQIFQPFPAIRHLGRALTIVISAALGLIYMLPVVLWSSGRRPALLGFALRASVIKVIILVVLFYVARHYGSQLGRNVGGLMLGLSIYVAINVAIMASAKAFNPVLFGPILWFMAPLASALCLLVWNLALWEVAPMPSLHTISTATGGDSEAVALELTRFNSELSKLLHK